MSVFIVSEQSIAIIEVGFRKFSTHRGVHAFLSLCQTDSKALARKLFALNVRSFNEKYKSKESSKIELPHVAEMDVSFGAFVKAMRSWAYQIEGKAESSSLGKMAILFANCLLDEMNRLQGTPEFDRYENAEWG